MYKLQKAVLCMCAPQTEELRAQLHGSDVTVCSVHTSYGVEADIVIFSPSYGDITDFTVRPHRIIQALSRAKDTVIIVGDRTKLANRFPYSIIEKLCPV